jgi:hypothetical protein
LLVDVLVGVFVGVLVGVLVDVFVGVAVDVRVLVGEGVAADARLKIEDKPNRYDKKIIKQHKRKIAEVFFVMLSSIILLLV